MHYSLRLTYTSILIILYQLAAGQTKLKGTFINNEKVGQITVIEVLTISKDSIWFSRKKIGKDIAPGDKFENWAGTIKYHKTGYNNGPFYSGFMFVVSCDTCPQFWQHTTKRRDSLTTDIEEWLWVDSTNNNIAGNKITVKDDSTSSMYYDYLHIEDPTDIKRLRQLIFTLTSSSDILLHRKVYRRQKSKT